MERLIYFLLWPAIAGIGFFLNCWKWGDFRLGTSIWIGIGMALGVVALELAMVAL